MSSDESVPTWGQAAHILGLFREKRVTRQQIDELVKSGLLADLLDADIPHIDRSRFWEALDGEYSLLVNESLPLWNLVQRAEYDWVNPNITEAALAASMVSEKPRMYTQQVRFVRFSEAVTREEASLRIGERGFRPCGIRKLLAFGVQYPQASWEAPIAALGDDFLVSGPLLPGGLAHTLAICGARGDRRLRMYPASAEFPLRTRFLVAV